MYSNGRKELLQDNENRPVNRADRHLAHNASPQEPAEFLADVTGPSDTMTRKEYLAKLRISEVGVGTLALIDMQPVSYPELRASSEEAAVSIIATLAVTATAVGLPITPESFDSLVQVDAAGV